MDAHDRDIELAQLTAGPADDASGLRSLQQDRHLGVVSLLDPGQDAPQLRELPPECLPQGRRVGP